MREITIKLNEIEKLKEFEAIVSKCDFDLDAISTANSRYIIDAKSIMGLFGLNLSNPVKIVTGHTGEAVDALFDELKRFEV